VTGLLNARQVADMLGHRSPETVLRWVRRGELPAYRLPGGAIRFREDELEEWLADRATVADTGPDSKAPPRGAVTPTRGLTTRERAPHG
jgi:excisionase family DNA binding protein